MTGLSEEVLRERNRYVSRGLRDADLVLYLSRRCYEKLVRELRPYQTRPVTAAPFRKLDELRRAGTVVQLFGMEVRPGLGAGWGIAVKSAD